MITYVNRKGRRLPKRNGAVSCFNEKNDQLEYFIIGMSGWKKAKKNEWKEETIPDLLENGKTGDFDDEDFRNSFKVYAEKWGIECAQEFLSCCDAFKPTYANRILNPPQNKWTEEQATWFKSVFQVEILTFNNEFVFFLGNRYSFDIIKFNDWLEQNHKYSEQEHGSIREFISSYFKADADKLLKLLT